MDFIFPDFGIFQVIEHLLHESVGVEIVAPDAQQVAFGGVVECDDVRLVPVAGQRAFAVFGHFDEKSRNLVVDADPPVVLGCAFAIGRNQRHEFFLQQPARVSLYGLFCDGGARNLSVVPRACEFSVYATVDIQTCLLQAGKPILGPGTVVVRREEGDVLDVAVGEIFSHLDPRQFTECRIEKSPVRLVQIKFRDAIHRLLPPDGHGELDTREKLEEGEGFLHEQRAQQRSDGMRVVLQADNLTTAVNQVAAVLVHSQEDEFVLAGTGCFIDKAQKVQFTFALGGKAAPAIASRDEDEFAEPVPGIPEGIPVVLGEKITPTNLLEDSGLHFLRKEFAEEGEARMVAFCHLFQEGQRVIGLELAVFPVVIKKTVQPSRRVFTRRGEPYLLRGVSPKTPFTADTVNLSVILQLPEDGLYGSGTRLERGHEHADAGQRIVTFVRGLD